MGQDRPVADATPRHPERVEGAREWIHQVLAANGLRPSGEIELVRVRPWSTQLRAPTASGPVWFKANCAAFAFEASLHALLARLLPGAVDMPMAIEADRGWLLTADRGPTLRQTRSPTAADWQHVLAVAADLQHRLAPHAADLVATGLPQRRPGDLPNAFAEAVDDLAALPSGHPSRLDADDIRALTAAVPSVVEAARVLADSPLPVSLQHGDLHPGNVFATRDGLRLFDFGDAQWAAASEVLCIPQAVIEHADFGDATVLDHALTWPSVLDAYRLVWADRGVRLDRAEFDRLVASSAVSHAVHRSGTWLDAIAAALPDELDDWGDGPRRHLLAVLRPA